MARKYFDMDRYQALARQAAAEGAVLLKNDREALPLAEGSRIALFGRSHFNYYKSGTGSGGLVNTRYVVSIAEGLKKGYQIDKTLEGCYAEWLKEHPFDAGQGWAQEPWFQEEMPLEPETVGQAARENEAAIIILGRTAGEDKDNSAMPGSYLLDPLEERMLELVCKAFRRTIVLLNVGNIIDMKWVERYDPAAVLYLWQGGQEGGNAALDVLTGRVNPSGRLTDTAARDIQDYPAAEHYGDDLKNIYAEDIYVGYRYFETFARDKVLYPFGYGLSYTTFRREVLGLRETAADGKSGSGSVALEVKVTNTGSLTGREVVQVYCGAPSGRLGRPARALAGFAKTALLEPGQEEILTLEIPWRELAGYDDAGVTGAKSAWVLEAGEYRFYLGGDVRSAEYCGSLWVEELTVAEQLREAMAPAESFERMKAGREASEESAAGSKKIGMEPTEGQATGINPGQRALLWEQAPVRSVSPMEHRNQALPKEVPYAGEQGYRLQDVAEGRVSMEGFLSQLTDEDLCCLVRGEGMCSPKVTPGTASAFGGITERLKGFGIPVACCADGPSGIRMDSGNIAFAMPNGTCLACTWDVDLVRELYCYEGMELRKNRVDTLLGPGMNIHRHPLNGRNFEYFSEDPLLTGKIAAAQLQGMNRYGVTGTIKHFACNNQERKRNMAEAVVSERALREIYLRGYEIAVKEGSARSIMTSYNPVNRLWSASNYDLLTRILREDWGYRGIVMTDWWAKGNDEGQEATVGNLTAMVRAQNDLFMVVPDAVMSMQMDCPLEALEKGEITRGEYLRSADNICRFLLSVPAWSRQQGVRTELDEELESCLEEDGDVILDMENWELEEELIFTGESFDTGKGSTTRLQITVRDRGWYQMELTCRVIEGLSALAQVSASVIVNHFSIGTVTLTGEDTEWRTVVMKYPVRIPGTTFLLKTFFAQSGMEIRELKISKAEEKQKTE
ncbi:MAG: glycoside hydrolase family 3 C-terminal domain-containing protein [Roseburia sp.]|nr:glycoside hydrolase family 3 C-terminal domain-containing protein [Roseburia sp.]MCM1098117.1 glycoside hydrolase family 3 C-terminal domain-containing protein [Ruminococcus flavefaciens]